MRLLKLSVLLLVVAVAGCKQQTFVTAKTEADNRVLNRLNERIPRVDFDDTKLKDAIQFFRIISGVNIYVDWGTLAYAGVRKNARVKLHLQDVPCGEALTKCLGGLKSDPPITYALADGVVLISTPWHVAELARLISTRPATTETEADKRIMVRLNKRIREINFDDIELKDVVQFLADVSGVRMKFRWDALGMTVSKANTVNLNLRDVTVHTALTLCLDDAAPASPTGYIIKKGRVHILARYLAEELRDTTTQPATDEAPEK